MDGENKKGRKKVRKERRKDRRKTTRKVLVQSSSKAEHLGWKGKIC